MAKKKRKTRRKRAVNEAEIRQMIQRSEKLLDQWLRKMNAANNAVNKYSKRISYYNGRLAKLSEQREVTSLRTINIDELEN